MTRPRQVQPSILLPGSVEGDGGLKDGMPLVPRMAGEGVGLGRGASASRGAAPEEKAGHEAPGAFGSGGMPGLDFADALDDYFFRQSRLAPMGGTAFDPRLSPPWAGLKLPV